MTYQCPYCGLTRSANQSHGSILPQCQCAWQFNPPAPKREWVGLTDEQLESIWAEFGLAMQPTRKAIARAIEDKLKEKNT